ncbi:MAG: PAS domain-containing sensor histidine kinase [Phenylobacterium sp.]|uniref:sensor histidine kinase NtrY-like n=1 Tax=Phenylobacterium sp. TaxID=1871053 RepID=UPI003567164D
MASMALSGGPGDSRRSRLWRFLQSGYLFGGVFALASGLTAVAVFLAASPPAAGPVDRLISGLFTLLGFNLILILALAGVIGLQLLGLLNARSRDAGARLHLRFVTLFGLAAVVPAVIVAIFFGVLVSRGLENWFSPRVQTVVENSANVARTYIDTQTTYVQENMTQMAGDLRGAEPALSADPASFNDFLATQAGYRGFLAVYLIDREGQILARAEAETAPEFVTPTAQAFASADQGEIFIADFANSDSMRALFRLDGFGGAYLHVVRPVDEQMFQYLREAQDSLVAYREAEVSRGEIQAVFALSYFETALLVLIGAVWLGVSAANAFSAPVGRLVQAAGRVAAGDLTARVDAERDPEEIAVLSRAFNSMTHDLQAQQSALSRAREEAEERRQFIETVLSEVSAGVIGLDAEGRISAANRQAAALLGLAPVEARGSLLVEAAPEFAEIASAASSSGEAEAEVDLLRGRDSRRLRVRARRSEGGLVLTFDDITRLVAAQRNAAWSDVARRIAHEIKNPLTPIQLSAERLRRKYRKTAPPDDLEIFDRCIDTIVRQVGDIGRMVDEFSGFARMPAPKFTPQDAAELIRAAVFAQRVASPDLRVELKEPAPEVTVLADGRMLAQALTNVLKNAAEAIAGAGKTTGQITAELISDEDGVSFIVEDEGVGLPAKDRHRLTEPYVTTREKGTGLGLAIVKRILEDHGGELILSDATSGQGARVTLRLPASVRIAADAAPERAAGEEAVG